MMLLHTLWRTCINQEDQSMLLLNRRVCELPLVDIMQHFVLHFFTFEIVYGATSLIWCTIREQYILDCNIMDVSFSKTCESGHAIK